MTRSRRDFQNDPIYREQSAKIATLAETAAREGNTGLQKTCGQALAGNKRARTEAVKVILAAESLLHSPSFAKFAKPRAKTAEEWDEMKRQEHEDAQASKEHERGRGRKKGAK